MKNISSILSDLSPVECDIYKKKISRDTGISEGAIKMEILGNNKQEKHLPERHRETGKKSLNSLL